MFGPPPIADVWWPFEPGVFALYGKNGAGKTRLLRALADLLGGRPIDGYLVARVVESEEAGPRFESAYPSSRRVAPEFTGAAHHAPWSEQVVLDLWEDVHSVLCQSVGFELATDMGNDELDFYQRLDDQDDDDIVAEIEEIEAETTGTKPLHNEDEAAAVLRSVLDAELVCLTPTGGAWFVAPVLYRPPEASILRSNVAELLDLGAAVRRGQRLGEAIEALMSDLHEGLVQDVAREEECHEDCVSLDDPSLVLPNAVAELSAFRRMLHRPEDLDDDPSTFLREVERLRRLDEVPYRLAQGDLGPAVFDEDGVLEPLLVRDDELDADDLTTITTVEVAEGVLAGSGELIENSFTASVELVEAAAERQSDVQEIYDLFLPDAPTLALSLSSPSEWFLGPALRWEALVESGPIPLEGLSQAQLRWALVSMSLSAGRPPSAHNDAGTEGPGASIEPIYVFLDEPDAALHATAERHAIEGLVEVASARGATIIVSTHSHEFLNHPGVRPLHVHREQGNVALRPLDDAHRVRVDELGLTPADLLMLQRMFLVVEGEHDRVVIDELIGEQLAKLRVLVLPIHGGALMATSVDSYLLAHLSDSPVMVALDNLDADWVAAYWGELCAAEGSPERFDEITRRYFAERRRSEEHFLKGYCRAAAQLGQTHRFGVYGFQEADIQEYLPVGMLVPGAESWQQLRADFAGQKKHTSFKPWIKAKFGIEFDEMSLRAAARALDAVPEDFQRLCDELVNLYRESRHR